MLGDVAVALSLPTVEWAVVKWTPCLTPALTAPCHRAAKRSYGNSLRSDQCAPARSPLVVCAVAIPSAAASGRASSGMALLVPDPQGRGPPRRAPSRPIKSRSCSG